MRRTTGSRRYQAEPSDLSGCSQRSAGRSCRDRPNSSGASSGRRRRLYRQGPAARWPRPSCLATDPRGGRLRSPAGHVTKSLTVLVWRRPPSFQGSRTRTASGYWSPWSRSIPCPRPPGSGTRGLHPGDHPSLERDEYRQRSKSSSALRALVRNEALARAGSSTTKAVVPRYAVFSQLAALPL
jgi:hypothetical protein